SKGVTTLLNWAFWLNVGYYNGAVLQRNELLRTIEITTDSFAYQAEALVKLIARGATYKHCYGSIQERAAGRSSALSLKNQIAVWRTILHLLAVVGLFWTLPLVPALSARRRSLDACLYTRRRRHSRAARLSLYDDRLRAGRQIGEADVYRYSGQIRPRRAK